MSTPSYPILRAAARLGTRLGLSNSMVLLGAIHEADDPGAAGIGEANRLYRAAAAKGNTQAMWSLGVNYLSSKGGETDHKQAVEWIGRAAAGGHGMAAWAMGKMHLSGRVVDKNIELGLNLLKQSAASGFRDSGLLLAEIYRTGQYGVEVSEEAARNWLYVSLPLGERLLIRAGLARLETA
ncbi:MAG: hypothetical protein AAGE01_02585 [Pseudomonadota bacterium]